VLGFGVSSSVLAKAVDSTDQQQITVFFRNNKAWFKSVDIIYYPPGNAQGKVRSRLMFPFQRTKLELPAGTKIYLAKGNQLDRWREGYDLRETPPSITLRISDEGEEYDIFRT